MILEAMADIALTTPCRTSSGITESESPEPTWEVSASRSLGILAVMLMLCFLRSMVCRELGAAIAVNVIMAHEVTAESSSLD